MLTGPMLAVLALSLAIGAAAPAVAGPAAVPVVPPEPEAVLLPGETTLQAVVADLDGTGSRAVLRLLAVEDGSVRLEAWRHAPGGWSSSGEVEIVPAGGSRFDVVFDATAARLLVRRDADRQRVTLVRQPRFEPPRLEPQCCLQLHDVRIGPEGVELRSVGSAPEAVDALLALDLDGDGVDELLGSRSLRPLGRTAYPSEALVFRWRGDVFGAPTLTELPVGSGDSPFVLGDTDGRPGQEAGIVTTAARGVLHRLVLDEGDRVRAEGAGIVADAVLAVSFDRAPGVAILGPSRGLSVHRWPSGAALGPAIATLPVDRGRLIGAVDGRVPQLLLARSDAATVERLSLPELAVVGDAAVASPAAMRAMAVTSLRPYRGPLPGGGPDGRPALIHDGVLTTGASEPRPVLVPSLANAEPVGLAGPDRAWLAVLHDAGPAAARLDPAGGRLEPTGTATGGAVSLVPLAGALSGELDDGAYDPLVGDAHVLDEAGTLGISAEGFGVRVEAPAGSRVHAGVGDGSTSLGVQVVPDDGHLDVRLPLPRALLPYGGDRIWLAVVPPSGHAYVASWRVLALTGPPPLETGVETSLGSASVRISGETVPYATVDVAGRPVAVDTGGRFETRVELPPWPTTVEVTATDPAGNVARAAPSATGFLDYRTVPWLPIAVTLVGVLAAVLWIRVPSLEPQPLVADDGASLEEVDPDREA